ncbi:hypothetical protein QM565_32885 [Geitlerinema splendidum]|jgi:hypothetical protein|nr:hypothetical protein [Geitlerinema splendidum]
MYEVQKDFLDVKKRIVFISCTKNKIWNICPNLKSVEAGSAYLGPDFVLSNHIAQKLGGRIIIFSAKYGFLNPNDEIPGYYDVTFSRKNDPYISMEVLETQAMQMKLLHYKEIYILCSEPYHQRIKSIYAGLSVKLYNPILDCYNLKDMCYILNKCNISLTNSTIHPSELCRSYAD